MSEPVIVITDEDSTFSCALYDYNLKIEGYFNNMNLCCVPWFLQCFSILSFNCQDLSNNLGLLAVRFRNELETSFIFIAFIAPGRSWVRLPLGGLRLFLSNNNYFNISSFNTFQLVVTPLSYLHLSHLTLRACTKARPVSHMILVIWPRSPRVPHSSVVRASNQHLEGHGVDSRWEGSDVFWVITTISTFLLLTHFS